ncbi:carboxypeptidase-like regulatory domain-containing protein [Spirillospora sp. NPDC052269]
MRRTLAALVSLLTVLALPPFAATASAEAASAPVVMNAHFTTTTGGAVPQVSLKSESGVTRVDMRFRALDSSEPYPAFDDVLRTLGTANAGTWSTGKVVPLQPGRTSLDLEITENSGEHTVLTGVAFTDAGQRAWTVTADGGNPTHSRPFKGYGQVVFQGTVDHVTAQLYRAGTNEKVGDELPMTRTETSDHSGYSSSDYETDGLFDAPVGTYEITVTAFDARGDHVAARSGVQVMRLAQQLADVRVSPDAIDFDHPEATVTGRVTDTAGTPLGGVTVSLNTPEATATSTADGSFTLKVTPTTTAARLSASGHGDYASTVAAVSFPLRAQPTRVSITRTPGAARVGEKATLSGLLERQNSAGAWVPFPGRAVKLSFVSDGTKQTTELGAPTTGPDGRYSLPVTVTGSGTWQVGSAGNAFLQSSMAGEHHGSSFWTRITGVTARPNPVAVGGKVTVSGQIVRTGAPAGSANVVNVPVSLTFSPGPGRMFSMAKGRTDAAGRFSLSGVAKSDGKWWVEFSGDQGIGGTWDEPSATPRIFVDTKYKTAISSFDASPEPVRKGRTLTVKGKITKFTGSWKPATGAALTIYFKPKGSSKWKAMGTTKADRNGRFTKGFKASADGTWAAAYAGSSTYLGIWSAGDYVDVR